MGDIVLEVEVRRIFFPFFFPPNEHFFNDNFRGFVKKDMMEIFSLRGERRSTHACAGETEGERA